MIVQWTREAFHSKLQQQCDSHDFPHTSENAKLFPLVPIVSYAQFTSTGQSNINIIVLAAMDYSPSCSITLELTPTDSITHQYTSARRASSWERKEDADITMNILFLSIQSSLTLM
jgi:hypothetical protein